MPDGEQAQLRNALDDAGYPAGCRGQIKRWFFGYNGNGELRYQGIVRHPSTQMIMFVVALLVAYLTTFSTTSGEEAAAMEASPFYQALDSVGKRILMSLYLHVKTLESKQLLYILAPVVALTGADNMVVALCGSGICRKQKVLELCASLKSTIFSAAKLGISALTVWLMVVLHNLQHAVADPGEFFRDTFNTTECQRFVGNLTIPVVQGIAECGLKELLELLQQIVTDALQVNLGWAGWVVGVVAGMLLLGRSVSWCVNWLRSTTNSGSEETDGLLGG